MGLFFLFQCNGCMPVRAVCKPRSPDLKGGALATDIRGCSLWRSLLERPPPAPESWVRDPLGARTSCGGVDPGGGVTPAPMIYSLFVHISAERQR